MSRGMVIYSNVYIIQRGAFALLVSTFRAMRRPYRVERATRHRLHVLFVCALNLRLKPLLKVAKRIIISLNMAKNDKQWSSATPGLLIILLDQSGSMLNDYEGTGTSRTKYATLAVNKVIDNIIQKNFDGEAPKNRCFISVIGYNHDVKELCSGWLKDLDANPLRYETLKKKTPDGTGGLVEVEVKQPVWVEPIDKDGATNMLGAFQLAKDLAEKWMVDHVDGPAPVIINISDGVPYYDRKDVRDCMKETVDLAKEIMNLSNEDGNVLIFNAQIDSVPKAVFPSDRNEISQEAGAAKNELPTKDGSRGCIFGADGVQLIQLIDFGSSKGQGDKGLV